MEELDRATTSQPASARRRGFLPVAGSPAGLAAVAAAAPGVLAAGVPKRKADMCFRPAAASTPKTCPACGMINPAVAETCVKCGAELPEDRIKCPIAAR